MYPNFLLEKELGGFVIGIDEVGRGALAGPVIVSAVLCPYQACFANSKSEEEYCLNLFSGVNDSKKLSSVKRESIFNVLSQYVSYSIGIATAYEVDKHNVLQATFIAMKRAIINLEYLIEKDNILNKGINYTIIVDGNIVPEIGDYKVLPVVKGDSKSMTIATASILAKVIRDRMMIKLHNDFPIYNWHKNKGYGTKEHIKALLEEGKSIEHRESFIKFMYNQAIT